MSWAREDMGRGESDVACHWGAITGDTACVGMAAERANAVRRELFERCPGGGDGDVAVKKAGRWGSGTGA